ncbi:tripartite tricarboxylate transporter TctB family protein [Thalassospiraceae bacterium SW-3-3]|nr:tripartite tricarboxylate transporter TctB family protein [Thalassospiraceae bacterium SW-3-3]
MTVKVTEAAAAGTGVSAASRARTELARLISYIVFGGVSVVLSSMAAGLPTSRWEPLGAGTFPKLVFALLAVLCLIAAVRSIIEIVRAGGLAGVGAAFTQWLYVRRVAIGLFVLFAVYLGVMPWTGFSLASFVFLLIAQLMIAGVSRRTVMQSIIAALIFSVGLNLLFAEVFNVFLPRGVLFAG